MNTVIVVALSLLGFLVAGFVIWKMISAASSFLGFFTSIMGGNNPDDNK